MEAGNIGEFYFLCACCWVGGASLCGVEICYCPFVVDVGIFWNEESAYHDCGTYKRYPSGDGVLVGALVVFGERLNFYQWIGVLMAVFSFFMLSRSGKKEGIDFKHNKWIYYVVMAAVLGAVSGLYDKYLMAPADQGGIGLDRMIVQSWYNIYQLFMMGGILILLWWPKRKSTTPFHWHWCIILISIFLSAADFVYFYALSLDGAMISIVSMVRRGSVLVSFIFGAMVFREKNLKSKAVDLVLVLIGMIFLYLGSQ